MRIKTLSFIVIFSFLITGISISSFAQEKKEHKNTKIEGKTEHTGSTQINRSKKSNKVISDSAAVKTKNNKPTSIKVTDKEVGRTEDGKTIYQGPKGGKYYLSDKGKKIYLKEKSSKTSGKKEAIESTKTRETK